MGKRSTIERQINTILFQKQAFGESRHAAKDQLREQMGESYRFGMSDDKIHSYDTFDTYQKACQRFGKWLQEVKCVGRKEDIQKCKAYAKEYLEYRLNEDKVSVWTVKMERSALSKLYGEKIEIDLPTRDIKQISRSRNEKSHDKHFSEDRHKAIVDMAKATGCRRSDLERLKPSHFFTDRNNIMWVKIEKSKGGRNRVAPVLPQYRKFVENFISDKAKDKRLFPNVPKVADIHSYRGEYAKELYNLVKADEDFKEKILLKYPQRHEYKTVRDKETGERKTYEITSPTITTRGENKQTYDRDDIYAVSQALGHNRIDVSLTFYLRA